MSFTSTSVSTGEDSAEELITTSINRIEELKIQVLSMKTKKGRFNNIIKMANELKNIMSLWQEGLNPYGVNLLSSKEYKQKILSESQIKLNEIKEIKSEMQTNN